MAELILSKESSESEIKAYFNAVLKLSQSDNEFPINLDEVWPLVYSRRQEAVRALTSNEQFIGNVDYQAVRKDAQQDYNPLAKNGKQDSINGWGGNNKIDYYLTVSCMEFFIARKVRPVFEVYRQVFHKTAQKVVTGEFSANRQNREQSTVRDKIAVAKFLSSFLNLNDSSKLLIAKSIADPFGLPTPDYTPSHGILKSATELLRLRKSQVSAREFNTIAIEKGYLCELERKSSHGQKRTFKSITEKGLTFGENQVNPNNPKSTQPLWYESKFDELLGKLGFRFIGGQPYEN